MKTAQFFFKQGLDHILDIDGIDHLLFILSITVFFQIKEWRKIVVLITAFTIGHSITLVLSVIEILTIERNLIEQLIPITIIITCLNNLAKAYMPSQRNYLFLYGFVLLFGCIHGLAFSNFLKMSLFEDENIVTALLGFNIGLEVGQLIIVLVFLTITSLLINFIKQITHKRVIVVTSLIVLLWAIKILIALF